MKTTRSRHAAKVAPDDSERSHGRKYGPESKAEPETSGLWELDGITYDTYQDFVNAKRKRNQARMLDIGLVQAAEDLKEAVTVKKASQRGISRKRKSDPSAPLLRRKSNRLAGVQADGRYVEQEASGKFQIASEIQTAQVSRMVEEHKEPEHFKQRINDGADISLTQAVELCDPKWYDENSPQRAIRFASESLSVSNMRRASTSPRSVVVERDSMSSEMDSLSVDDPDCVAKVTPERIYSVSCHPSPDSLTVCAGDKLGYVGIWNVDDHSDDHDGVHLFRVHSRPVSCLSWTPSGSALMSSSYDGSVRWFDAASQTFSQIFATYDDSVVYREELGRGLDNGYNDWIQYVCPDHRNASEQCFFLSTSSGNAIHVDLRVGRGKITFHEELSEKKINTLSLHPNGYSLASGGLDGVVRLWDIRKFGDSRSHKRKSGPTAIATQFAGRSINSALFSPSGERLVSTTMANNLDVTHNFHLANKDATKPNNRVRHNNQTGRWLTTFMAQWHPANDVFVVGSMNQPRAFDVFDRDGNMLRAIRGEALTAVVSRCCFHPARDKLVLVGGNSSGRVTVAR